MTPWTQTPTQEQPAYSRLELACEPSAIRIARAHTRGVLLQWAVPSPVTGDALLVVSELATNAVEHTRRSDNLPPWPPRCPEVRCFVLTLRYLPGCLQIYVYDDDSRPPVVKAPSADEAGGRGLFLVAELSERWGYVPASHVARGKVVWAELAFPGAVAPPESPDLATSLPQPQSGAHPFQTDPHIPGQVRPGPEGP
jgi:hypothetical protein